MTGQELKKALAEGTIPERKRIGKTLMFTLEVTTNGEYISLDGRNITVEITAEKFRYHPRITTDGTTLFFEFPGKDQKVIGIHTATIWENYGEERQTVVDRWGIVELVKYSWQEDED